MVGAEVFVSHVKQLEEQICKEARCSGNTESK